MVNHPAGRPVFVGQGIIAGQQMRPPKKKKTARGPGTPEGTFCRLRDQTRGAPQVQRIHRRARAFPTRQGPGGATTAPPCSIPSMETRKRNGRGIGISLFLGRNTRRRDPSPRDRRRRRHAAPPRTREMAWAHTKSARLVIGKGGDAQRGPHLGPAWVEAFGKKKIISLMPCQAP